MASGESKTKKPMTFKTFFSSVLKGVRFLNLVVINLHAVFVFVSALDRKDPHFLMSASFVAVSAALSGEIGPVLNGMGLGEFRVRHFQIRENSTDWNSIIYKNT